MLICHCVLSRNRTCDLLDRNQTLYPLSYKDIRSYFLFSERYLIRKATPAIARPRTKIVNIPCIIFWLLRRTVSRRSRASARRRRRGRDSNPGTRLEVNTLAVCRFRPLSHLSKALKECFFNTWLTISDIFSDIKGKLRCV